ncbi:early endosome antigen 1 [Leptidea sinapis]|uniref:early endosome antigen 1 n=1 Tax=Leptidea sinapis TaxID=189913 RepID=UPI0021C48896|nr:early endosome antigen 1 [Leptidea sinapis]
MEGMSIFKGAASINLNNSAQDRLEQLEELEDQKRRKEELEHKLANAFDDLHEDDEASVNSSGNYTLDNTQANGKPPRTGLPPTYDESLNRLKDAMVDSDSTKQHCETPKSHHNQHMRYPEEPLKHHYNPYGGGDCQNNYYQQEFKGHINGYHNFDSQQEHINHENLKTMFGIKEKECEQLVAKIQNLDSEIDSLRARLAASVHDKDKAELSLKEAHGLLAKSKHHTIALEQNIDLLRQRVEEGNLKNEQLKMELVAANLSLQEVQQKMHTIQVAHSHDTNAMFREQQDRHREEMNRLQDELLKTRSRLDERDNEIKVLEKRYRDSVREKEEILEEKSAKINRLANELETAQNKLVSGETSKLKEKVFQLTSERNTAREQVKDLGSKLETTARELVQCRNKLASQREFDAWRSTLQQILKDALPDTHNNGDPTSPGKLATLKEIVHSYKQNIHKLSQLKEEVTKRDKRIEQYRKQESELQLKLEEQRDVEMKLNSRVFVLQNKLDLLGSSSDGELLDEYKQQNDRLRKEGEDLRAEIKNLELKYADLEMEYEKLQSIATNRAGAAHEANADLLQELERYSSSMKETLKENGELKTLYLQVCSARDSVTREMKEIRNSILKERDDFKKQEKDYIERIEKEKQQVEKLRVELNNAKQELEQANKRITELHTEFTDKQEEFTDKLNKFLEDEKCAMRKEMEACIQCENQLKHIKYLEDQLNKCNIRLASQESNETLMNELRGKAEFFQNYIMERFKQIQQDQRKVDQDMPIVNGDGRCASDEEAGTNGDNIIAAQTELMKKEKEIREQIADKFTLEMKTMEMNFARQLKEMETEQLTTVTKLKDLLERKAKEVGTLKDFILSERAKVTQVLESKENEISELIKDHNKLQAQCQNVKQEAMEWRHKAEKYKERLARLSSFDDVLKKERDELKLKTQECNSLKAQLNELQSQMLQIEEEYKSVRSEHGVLLDKYKNVKKTVYTYKDYMSKKDSHINSEMTRIQEEYRNIFVALQKQINYLVKCRVNEERRGGSQAQQYQPYDCTEIMKKLNEDFARLAHSNFADSVTPTQSNK